MINHHPSDTTLAAYAAGTMPEALAIVAATHIARCFACRQSVDTFEATGGSILDEMVPVALSGGALDRMLARAEERPAARPRVLHPELPAPLNRVSLGRWWPIGIGTRYRPLHVSGGAWGGLVLAQPGRSLPRHGHEGLELTCILSGSFVDASGQYLPGDLSEPVTDHDQPPMVIGAEPCLCIIASEGMRLRGLLGLAQRMFLQ